MKKALSLLLALVMVVCLCSTAFAADIRVEVDGTAVTWTDAKPFIDANGRTLVPLRPVAEAMGLTVNWNPSLRVAEFVREMAEDEEYYGSTEIIQFPIDSKTAKTAVYYSEGVEKWLYSNEDVAMDTAAVIVNDRTYAPVRYLAEFFGYSVDWIAETSTVDIYTKTYITYYDIIGLQENSVTIAWSKGEDYDVLRSMKVTSATVDGKDAGVHEFTASEMKELQSVLGDDYFYAVTISGDFSVMDKEYTVVWNSSWNYVDGSSDTDSMEEIIYTGGYGGY